MTNAEPVLPADFLPLAPSPHSLAQQSRLFRLCLWETCPVQDLWDARRRPREPTAISFLWQPASFLPFRHLSVLVRCVMSRVFHGQEVALGGWGHAISAEPEVPILLFQYQKVITFHVQSIIYHFTYHFIKFYFYNKLLVSTILKAI